MHCTYLNISSPIRERTILLRWAFLFRLVSREFSSTCCSEHCCCAHPGKLIQCNLCDRTFRHLLQTEQIFVPDSLREGPDAAKVSHFTSVSDGERRESSPRTFNFFYEFFVQGGEELKVNSSLR